MGPEGWATVKNAKLATLRGRNVEAVGQAAAASSPGQFLQHYGTTRWAIPHPTAPGRKRNTEGLGDVPIVMAC